MASLARSSSWSLLVLLSMGAAVACGAPGDSSPLGDPGDEADLESPTIDPSVDGAEAIDVDGDLDRRPPSITLPGSLQALSQLTLAANTVQSGLTGDLVTWKDSAGATRTAFLPNPTATMVGGAFGGYLRTFTYVAGGSTRSIGPSAGEPGFGFVYAQRTSDYAVVSSKYVQGTRSVRSLGPNHVVLEYAYPSLKTSAGAVIPIKATIQWSFVTGRDHPTWSVTHDSSAVAANVNDFDSKSPYGGLEFSGTGGTTTDGVGWGDRRKFVTTSAPESMASTWSYTATNVVPYTQAWNDAKNAEMGLVQTERYTRHDSGYGWFYSNWGKTSATKVVDAGAPASQSMPANWNWTFLLNQYQLPDSTRKVMGWGMPFGSIGRTSVTKYGGVGSFSGYPYQSYAVSLVLGPKTAVTSQVAQTERLTASTFTATRGTVVTSGPVGAGRTDAAAYAPAGYDPVYGTFDVKAEAATGAVVATLDPKAKAIKFPVFRVLSYPLTTDPTGVKMGATALVEGADYAVSRDGTTVWFVLKKTISAVTTLSMNEGAPPPPPPPPGTWADLAVDPAQAVSGFTSDVFRWRDAQNKERSAALVRNDALDPAGYYGGYVRRFTYVKSDGSTLTATGGHTAQDPGWGYTLHHQSGGADKDTLSSRRAPGTYRQVFVGKHHAIHEYSWNVLRTQGDVANGAPPIDKPIKVTIRWVFANGKDGPVWAHTVDTSALAAGAINADDRSPAGELAFDGSSSGAVSGVGWGDRYRFKTTSAPLSMSSTWDYTQANRIPYVQLWSDGTNTEIGNVQTWDWQHKDAGYGWLYPNWGHTSANKIVASGTPATQTMPADWNWTFQLNQYEVPWDSAGKRMNWGTNFGSVGKASYPAYGDDRSLSGHPYSGRSTRLVLGPKGSTLAEVDQMTRAMDVTLVASEGSVVTSGPKGLGAAAGTSEAFSPPGWNHVYGVLEMVAAPNDGGIKVQITTNGQDLVNPVFRLKSWTQPLPATIVLGGVSLASGTDFLPSLVTNEGGPELWITLLRAVRGPIELAISPKGAPPPPAPPPASFADINHILSTGQSNSVFNGGTPVLTKTQPYANVSFDVGVMPGTQCNGDGCRSYQIPNGFIPLVEGDSFMYAVETMSSGMANQITRGARILLAGQPLPRNDHVVLVSIHGRSGRTYDCLRKSGCWLQAQGYVNPFSEGMLQVQWGKQIATQLGKSYAVRAVTAVHGESNHYWQEFPLNGSDGTPGKITSYADAMLEWQQDYEAGVKGITGQTGTLPLLVAQMHGWTGDPNSRTSRIPTDQYDAMIRAPGKVVIVAPEYPIPFRTDDGIHFTSEGGRRMGEYFAKAYARIVVEGQTWEPVRPKAISRAGNVITVTYFVPVPPLALDTAQVTNPGNYGFEYTDGSGAPPAIAGVQLTAPDTVQITLASVPAGANRRLRYAYTSAGPSTPGPQTGVRGNLRDSDPTPSLYGNSLQNWGITFDLAVP